MFFMNLVKWGENNFKVENSLAAYKAWPSVTVVFEKESACVYGGLYWIRVTLWKKMF